jgi:hypothetical protein
LPLTSAQSAGNTYQSLTWGVYAKGMPKDFDKFTASTSPIGEKTMPGDLSQGSTANLKKCMDDAVNELSHSDSSNINGALTHVKFVLDSYGSQRVNDPTSSSPQQTTFAEAFAHATEQELAQNGSLSRVVKNFGDANYGFLSQGMHYLHPTQLNQAEVNFSNSGRLLEADFTRDLINIGDNVDRHKLDRYAQDGDRASASRAILTEFDPPASFNTLANGKGYVTKDDIDAALSATPDKNQIAPLQYMHDNFKQMSDKNGITRLSMEGYAAKAGITPDMVAANQNAQLNWNNSDSGSSPGGDRHKIRQDNGGDLAHKTSGSSDNITDDRGRNFKFEKLDQNGIPSLVETPRGTMERLTGDKWFWHRVDPNYPDHSSLEVWHGSITPDDHGGWQWISTDGRISRLNKDGSRSSEYCGVVTRYHADGSSTMQFADGGDVKDSVVGGLRRTVKNGVTTEAQILTHNAIGESKRNGNDLYAQVQTEPNNAVSALQAGVVVYSSRKPDDSDKRKANFPLSAEDLAVIERLKKLDGDNPNIVVVRCTPPDKDKGAFYEVYSGLSEGKVVAGDYAAQGTVLGRVGQSGTFNLSIRRNAIGGGAVALRIAQINQQKNAHDGEDVTSSL